MLTDIRGIGPVYLKKLNELGIFKERELIDFMPSRYIDFLECSKSIEPGRFVFFKAEAVKTKSHGSGLRSSFRVKFRLDNGEELFAVWFNQAYKKHEMTEGRRYSVFGKAEENGGKITLQNPMTDDAENPKKLKGILPIYKARGLIQQGKLRGFLKAVLEDYTEDSIFEYSGAGETSKYVKGLREAYRGIHMPGSTEQADAAQRRVCVEDFARLVFCYRMLKKSRDKERGYFIAEDTVREFLEALPFEFTPSQRGALDQILTDMRSCKRMNRLIQGDVGSGKTAVALAAAYCAVRDGRQCAFLAPTELLTRQHYDTARGIFDKLNARVGILCAGLSGADKARELDKLKNGEIDVVVGTHSLFSERVIYKNLGLMIVDEQHKFGVRERNLLYEKSDYTDVLSLSATPIPRTLSLALLGEIDVSTVERRSKIDESIITKIVPNRKRGEMFRYIAERAAEGIQAYIVAPRIDDDEGGLTDGVKALYEELKATALKNVETAVLHGKTKPSERDAIMADFKQGKIKVLISTTVIEVGIDAENAGIIAVMNAERYGLAALHQLRGRVGRRGQKAYCFLHSSKEEENDRLRILKECSDGFLVAERDFEARGGGAFLGERQSGGFENAERYTVRVDAELIAEARKIANGVTINQASTRFFENMNYQKYYDLIKDTVLN